MAIIIEGEKQGKGTVQAVVGAVVAVLLLVATYWIFFAEPPLVEVIAPQELESISRISQVEVSPEVVTGSPVFKSLKILADDPELGEFGRENPFAKF